MNLSSTKRNVIIAFVFSLMFGCDNNYKKEVTNYKINVTKKSMLSGEVDSVYVMKGFSEIRIEGDTEVYLIPPSRNFEYKPNPGFDDLISLGDSVYKEANSDTLRLIKLFTKNYIFEIRKDLNLELR